MQAKISKILKTVLSKLPVYLFCVLFVMGYNRLFGSENALTGIIVLVGILMLLGMELGIKTAQAAIIIPLLYVIIAFAPKLALINPFWGIAVNFLSLGIILILSAGEPHSGIYIAFMMSYLFSHGVEASGEVFRLKALSLMLGGVIIAGVYFLAHRKSTCTKTVFDRFRELSLSSTKTQWYIKLTAALTLAMFLGDYFQIPRYMWINLTLLSLTTPEKQDGFRRAKIRLPGAVLGTAVFYVLFVLLIPPQYHNYVMMALGFWSMFVADYFVKTAYNSFSALSTALLLSSAKEAIVIRIAANAVGTVFALVNNWLFNLLFKRTNLSLSDNNSAIPYTEYQI